MTFLWRSRGARINTYYQPPIQFKALGKTPRTWSLGRVPKLLGKFQLSYNNHRLGEAAPTTMAPSHLHSASQCAGFNLCSPQARMEKEASCHLCNGAARRGCPGYELHACWFALRCVLGKTRPCTLDFTTRWQWASMALCPRSPRSGGGHYRGRWHFFHKSSTHTWMVC